METTLDRLRECAEEVVRQEPAVTAVVLFGSRARGTAGPRSDWDVALIEQGGRATETAYRHFDALPGKISLLGVGAEEIVRHKDTAGSLEAALARQGVTLAGDWQRPECRKEDLELDATRLYAHLANATDKIEKAVRAGIDHLYATGRERTDWIPLTTGSVDGAEHVAKAVLTGYGLSPREVHFLDVLARQLENSCRGCNDPRQADWAARIRAMNGTTRTLRLHDADYLRFTAPPLEPLARSVERTGQAQRAQILWLREMVERWPDLAGDVADAARAILRKGTGFDSSRTSYAGESVTADESTRATLGKLEESTADWIEGAGELIAQVEGEARDRPVP